MSATNTSNDLVPRTGSFPLPGGEGDSAPRKVKVNSQAVVLVIILGVSAAALASMRHIGMKSGMTLSTEQTKAQPAVMQDDPEKIARYDRIMKDLQQLQQPLDIALGELSKIPQLIPADRAAVQEDGKLEPITSAPVDKTALELAAKRNRMRAAAADLKLQSCMGGRVPLARIDGKFYRIGDLVNDMFIVREIDQRTATVEADGETFKLEMEMSKAGSSKSKR